MIQLLHCILAKNVCKYIYLWENNKTIRMKHRILSLALLLGILAACNNAPQNETAMGQNETIENLKTRRAIRAYKDSVPDMELLKQVIEAGTYAPTGMGKQSPVIVAVTDRETRDYISMLNAKVMGSDSDPFYGAPAVLIVLADKDIPTYLYDGSLVMGNLMNAAHAVGLGTCWIHRAKEVFESEEGKALLKKWGIEGNYEGIGNCIIGYPAQEAPQPKPRKPDYVYYVE